MNKTYVWADGQNRSLVVIKDVLEYISKQEIEDELSDNNIKVSKIMRMKYSIEKWR